MKLNKEELDSMKELIENQEKTIKRLNEETKILKEIGLLLLKDNIIFGNEITFMEMQNAEHTSVYTEYMAKSKDRWESIDENCLSKFDELIYE